MMLLSGCTVENNYISLHKQFLKNKKSINDVTRQITDFHSYQKIEPELRELKMEIKRTIDELKQLKRPTDKEDDWYHQYFLPELRRLDQEQLQITEKLSNSIDDEWLKEYFTKLTNHLKKMLADHEKDPKSTSKIRIAYVGIAVLLTIISGAMYVQLRKTNIKPNSQPESSDELSLKSAD
ncbi:MAG: hypothetical protein JNJ77_21215 [Planctomycetia bacterium]|nr:hypothetical protein [Planctomycetia bacterium]